MRLFDVDWLTRMNYGWHHPTSKHQWFNPEAVCVCGGDIHLSLTHTPRQSEYGQTRILPYGVGLVRSQQTFSYGYFEADIILPRGKNLFPAFWLISDISWPPEIDVLEGFSGRFGNYLSPDPVSPFKIGSNVHIKGDNGNTSTGREEPWFFYASPLRQITYKLLWTPNQIKIDYNNTNVVSITDEKVVEQFRGHRMHVIFNVGVHKPPVTLETPMIIKDFRFEKI